MKSDTEIKSLYSCLISLAFFAAISHRNTLIPLRNEGKVVEKFEGMEQGLKRENNA